MFILKKSDPQLGLALQSCVVTFENVAFSILFLSLFPWGFSITKSGRRMCHQAITMFCQHFCLTVPGDQLFCPLSYKVF